MAKRKRVVDTEQWRLYNERKSKYIDLKNSFKENKKKKGKTKEDIRNLRHQRAELKVERDIVQRMKPRNGFQRFIYRFGKVSKVIFSWGLFLLIVGVIVGYFVTAPIIKEAKNEAYEKLSSIDENTFNFLTNTIVYDGSGTQIAEIVKSNYSYTKIAEVPDYIQKGYIAVEDKRFLNHNGIDYKALVRAGVALIKNKGHITQGGSTITQQVVKNMLLTQEKSYKRKLVEFFIAPELEKKYSKFDIMEFYVNSCYYGNGCYGVGSASSYLFGKTPMELSVAECAMLVGLSNNPSAFSPVNKPEVAKEKRHRVLTTMLAEGVITQEQFDQADAEEFNLVLQKDVNVAENYQTSYAIHCATLKLMELNGFKFEYVFTDDNVYNAYRENYTKVYNQYSQEIRAGGYTLYTSFNQDLQNKLQESVDNGLASFKETDAITGKYLMQGAAVTVDNKTGYVVAIVGGRGTEDEFNRGFLAKRQPGSAMKPIGVYGPAMDTGRYYPSLIMEDKKIDGGPHNYMEGSYKGKVTLRYALAKSLNTIPFQIILDIKPLTGIEYLGKMKFDTLVPADNTVSFALGGITYGTRVCDIAKAYYTVQNEGIYTDNTCITKIEFQQKGVIFDGSVQKTRVYEGDVAYILTDMLKSVATEGTGVSVDGHPTGAKTGTTSDNKDSWYAGFTKHYTTSVWVGYDTPKEIPNLASGRYALKIWQNFMNKIHKDLEVEDWSIPSTVVTKYVDNMGNPVEKDTGVSDLFSQTLIDKLEEEKKVKESELLKKFEEEWLAKDASRQVLAEQLVSKYEGIVINSVEDAVNADDAYREAMTVVKLISDNTKRGTLTERLDYKKIALDAERKPFEDLKVLQDEKAAEEAKAKKEEEERRLKEQKDKRAQELAVEKEANRKADAQVKEKLLLEADEALNKLSEVQPTATDAYRQCIITQSSIEACSLYSEYSALRERFEKEVDRLGVVLTSKSNSTPAPTSTVTPTVTPTSSSKLSASATPLSYLDKESSRPTMNPYLE